MEMYWDAAIVLLHDANLQAVSHCRLYKLSSKHSPIKTRPEPQAPKRWTIKTLSAVSNKLLRLWNMIIALVGL